MFKAVDPNPDFSKLEEELLSYWEENKVFEKSLEQTRQGEPYTFYDGPPFATGLPHYGHILASTIKDVIPRYQTMKGRFVRRRWGWDCHGLPIEEIVERELGISGKKDIEEKIGIEKFNATCRKYVLQYADEWGKMVRRVARWTEFENSYKTMDTDYMESVWHGFKQIYDKDLVYEGRKVLLYCPRCETPVSNFEVAMDNSYKTITDESVIVKFQITNNKSQINSKLQIPNDKPVYLLAWTTTPWTLPGNLALAVGKGIDYVLVSKNIADVGSYTPGEDVKESDRKPEQYILAKELLPVLLEKGDYLVVQELKGADLVGLEYEPLFDIPEMQSDKSYRVYAADFVNTEEGTGIVHTAVVYGEDDYELGKREDLPVVPLLDEQGKFNEKSPELIRGMEFKESEEKIIADLEQRGLLFSKEKYEHSYPHCWRCEHPLFYNAIPAWFINIQEIKDGLLQSNDKEMEWYPGHLKHGRYENSVKDAPDWNISRNRFWGNPIPVWVCQKSHHTVIGSIKELSEKAINFDEVYPNFGKSDKSENQKSDQSDSPTVRSSGVDLHRPYIDEVALKCEHCGGEAHRISEIFDSWVEAGSMPFASVHYPFAQTPTQSPPYQGGEEEGVEKQAFVFPAQFVAEYIAQTRAWFYVMHVISFILLGKAPFENVVTTGTILAEDGSKMSKSKNNYPDPWQVIEKYGVDSLRFYLMNSTVMQAENLNFSEQDLAVSNRKVVRILWNVLNYFVTYANEANWKPGIEEDTKVLNQWMNIRTQELVNQVTEHLDSYDTVRATRLIEKYVNDLSTWYVRRSRGTTDSNFFATLYFSLITLAKVIAPIMPYMAEKIYLTLKLQQEEASIHLYSWPESRDLEKEEQSLLEQMEQLRDVVERVHALRAEAGIKLRQPLSKLELPTTHYKLPTDLLDILKDEVNVKEVVDGGGLKLDTTITPELKIEGLAAELTRQINNFRKESGFAIGEMAELVYETDSDELSQAMALVDKDKVYASGIKQGKSDGPEHETEIEIGRGKIKLELKIVR